MAAGEWGGGDPGRGWETMTKFEDGPASGKVLALRRAPLLLRVVRDRETGAIDALDQLADEPKASEEVIVYVQTENRGMVHINRGRHGSGWFTIATYKLHEPQPDQVTVRGALWPAWATEAAKGRSSS